MKDEDVSSGGANNDPFVLTRSSPAASSAGASSPAIPVNAGSVEWLGHGQASKASSRSHAGRQPPRPSFSTSAACSAPGSLQVSCRPWERGDLLRRLSTFSPSNWFAKPKGASSLACARRGWINIDLDRIECESCGATLKYSSSVSGTPDADVTGESCGATLKYSSFVSGTPDADVAGEDFTEQLDGGHRVGCPWRGNICPESLVQFPPAPPSALIGGFKDRCDGLLQFSALPVVSTSAVEQMQVSRGPQIERFLANSQSYVAGELGFRAEHNSGVESFRDENLQVYYHAQKLISLCGWESRWSADIQDCEEHSAQSARNGYCSGPTKSRKRMQDPGPSRRAFSTSTNKDVGQDDTHGLESKCESRSPLLDCSLCGATVRIWDFLTVSRPARFAPNDIDLPDNSKKLVLTRGVSAASGVSGWFGTDGLEKERADDLDEAATTGKRILPGDSALDLNLTMAGGVSSREAKHKMKSLLYQDADLGRDLKVGQPAGSEVGDRAASYESRGPGTRKRSAEEGGSTVDRPQLQMQQADSVEGTVIDRDGDEVYDSKQYSAGPSKRVRSSDASEAYPSTYRRDSFDAGPSRPVPYDMEADTNRIDPFDQVNEQFYGFPARDSTRVSSVIAMDTVCQSTDDDSLESVENFPVDNDDDANFPSSSAFVNQDLNDASELNYSNQAQQSACFQPAAVRAAGEAGVSSTNDGEEEVVNTEALTTQVKGGISFGISGGSVGMGASYEAEIHGADLSVHRSDSVVGDAEPVAEVVENQGQTGEFAPDQGQSDNFIPDEMDREDPHGDSQDVVSHLVGRADSGSKIVSSVKAESVESGEKVSIMDLLVRETAGHPSHSCNAVVCSGYEASKEEVTQKASPTNEVALESGFQPANAIGPIAESNYEGVEFDPIKHHNAFCPWVNGNVAAAGNSTGGASSSNGGASSSNIGAAAALSGWQLTLDALDAFQTHGNVQAQTVESESAASRHKDDRPPAGRNILAACHSFSKSRGRN